MKVILVKAKQAVKQSTNQLGNRRCSSANGFFTSEIVGAVTSLILMLALGLIGIGGIGISDVSAASTISVSSSGAQSIDVSPGASGVGTSIGVDEITVNTTCRAGYSFSLSTSVNDNNLYLNGDSSNNESGKYFTPSDGTTSLGNSTNNWGYYYNSSAPTTTPTSSDTFPAVPALNSPAAIIKTPATTASSTDISDSFNIYYGVSASSNLIPGTYKMIPDANNSNADGSIVYYVTMDTSCDVYTISYNANNGNGSIESQEVSSGSNVVLADNAFTRADHYFMGWSTNQNATTPEYRTNQTITPTGNMTLYAVWGDSTTTTLYDAVASLTKGAQSNDANIVANTGDTIAGIQATITKANSGVYTYDANTYGAASDAATTNTVYYYRGILDTDLNGTTSTYGTNGNGMDYPNYIILDADGTKDTSDTCWRIVRTTGSGGVKMIYNGTWTGSTCANAQDAAQATKSAFSGTSSIYRQIVRVGYTYNSTYATNTSQSGTIAQIFGTNSDPSVNNTRSTIKEYIEDTWYPSTLGASGGNYTSILEPSAGYCNDRTMNTSGSWTAPLAESTTIASTYGTSDLQAYYFGAYPRNLMTTAQPPSLTCGNKYDAIDRSTVDLYRYVSGSTGVSNELKYPAALLTADEVAFAGSGRTTASQGSACHYNSYLRSGSYFWLLSPSDRSSSGVVRGFGLFSGGSLGNYHLYNAYGVRPAISLASGTTATSGSGTAADPWVVEAPKTMQSVTSDQLAELMPNEGDTTTLPDARDGQEYSIAKINGAYWMTQNLRYLGDTGSATGKMTMSSTTSNGASGTMDLYSLSSSNAGNFGAYSNHCDSTNGYNYTCVYDSGNTTTGVWYNYAAATAGTITGSSNSTAATKDICPKGWQLPTDSQFSGIISYSSAFSPVGGGNYLGGSRQSLDYGFWWAATAGSGTTARPSLRWNGSSLSSNSYHRYLGRYVRCVRS